MQLYNYVYLPVCNGLNDCFLVIGSESNHRTSDIMDVIMTFNSMQKVIKKPYMFTRIYYVDFGSLDNIFFITKSKVYGYKLTGLAHFIIFYLYIWSDLAIC